MRLLVIGMLLLAAVPVVAQRRVRTAVVESNGVCVSNNCYIPTAVVAVEKEYVPLAIPVAYPAVAVPVYSYVNAGYPGYAAPAMPYAPGYPGFQAQTQQSQPTTVDQIADQVWHKLEQRLNAASNGPPPVVPSPTISAAPSTQGGPPAAVGPALLTGNKDISALLANKCIKCHAPAVAATMGGKRVLFDDNRTLLNFTREQRWDIYDAVYQGTMPKGGQPFSDQDVETIRSWARQK